MWPAAGRGDADSRLNEEPSCPGLLNASLSGFGRQSPGDTERMIIRVHVMTIRADRGQRHPPRVRVFRYRFRNFRAACLAARFPREMPCFAAFVRRGRFSVSFFRRFGFRVISCPAGRFRDFRALCLAAGFPHGMRGFAAFLPLFRPFGFLAISRPAGRFCHRFREFQALCPAAGFPHGMRGFADTLATLLGYNGFQAPQKSRKHDSTKSLVEANCRCNGSRGCVAAEYPSFRGFVLS